MFYDKDALGHIQWTLEIKLIDISNNSKVPCSLRTCRNKNVFAPMDDFLSLSRTVVKTYRKNSNVQCFDPDVTF